MYRTTNMLVLYLLLSVPLSAAFEECNVLGTPRARRLCRESMGYTGGEDDLTMNSSIQKENKISDDTPDDDDFFSDLNTNDKMKEEEKDDFFNDTVAQDDNFDENFDDLDDEENQNMYKKSNRLEPKIYIEAVESEHYDDDLPDCTTFEQQKKIPNVNCKEIQEPVIRWRDPVFERLLPQVWRDYQKRMRFDRELYGKVIEPLYIGNFSQELSNFAASLDLNLYDISVHGLSSIYLAETLVTRATDLSDLNMMMAFKFDELVINGTYTSTGWVGWSKIDSEGIQEFEIKLTNATVSPTILVNSTEQNVFGCGEGAGSVILDITLPITWSNLNVDFRNIGSMVNSILNIGAVALINTQEQNLVGMVKDQIKNEINSLICKQDP